MPQFLFTHVQSALLILCACVCVCQSDCEQFPYFVLSYSKPLFCWKVTRKWQTRPGDVIRYIRWWIGTGWRKKRKRKKETLLVTSEKLMNLFFVLDPQRSEGRHRQQTAGTLLHSIYACEQLIIFRTGVGLRWDSIQYLQFAVPIFCVCQVLFLVSVHIPVPTHLIQLYRRLIHLLFSYLAESVNTQNTLWMGVN